MQSLRLFIGVALSSLLLSTASAQGIGGFLNKAREKAKQVTNGGVNSTPTVAADTQREPPATPPALTAESNNEYTRDLLAYANTLTFHPHGHSEETPSEVYWYCWLRQKGYPIPFTWDQPALALTADNRVYLSAIINDMATNLVSGLNSTYGPQLKPRLANVKQIHLTTSPKKRSLDDFGTLEGYFFSFNPTTGVLTAAMSVPDGTTSIDYGLVMTKWLVKYIQ